MKRKALVTGCAGFIGSTLSEALIKQGYHVTGVDCFTGNYPRWIKERNLQSLINYPNFTWIEADLCKLDLKSLVDEQNVVFHQAALPGVRLSWNKEFKEYVDNNILATQLLLEAVKNSNIDKFVYASSSSIYGSMNGPTKEEQIPSPYSPYGSTKLSGEHLCHLYFANYQVPVVSLRYFTVYGPRQRPDMAFHRFIKNILLDQPINVFGDGSQTRDFTFIKDAVKANLLAMEKGKPGEVYNVGGGSNIALIDVIETLGKIMSKQPKINYLPEQPGDAKHTNSDISKAQLELGYSPSYPLEKGLTEQVAYIKSLYKL
ncbi:NAD-dependent epimerase/dehydratase family protein [Bacillus sp. FJAT-45350]|uniref:NAD-dependent epimerase/dehydratase family protein n=1 Tax=Bacillus sp. FJAT-45350 TaxID=2011014 RepID=UPI000BB67D4E|nr:NAD-dependent epimerase/dehydratase family protein [Bacillus sp. FJAT-45350]